MWLFSKLGFYSAVCARKNKGQSTEIDPDRIMVRARVKKHLTNLKAHFPDLIGVKIQQDAGTDYRYRIIVSKTIWEHIVAKLAAEIEYGNFKAAVKDEDYHYYLGRVWSVMLEMQREEK